MKAVLSCMGGCVARVWTQTDKSSEFHPDPRQISVREPSVLPVVVRRPWATSQSFGGTAKERHVTTVFILACDEVNEICSDMFRCIISMFRFTRSLWTALSFNVTFEILHITQNLLGWTYCGGSYFALTSLIFMVMGPYQLQIEVWHWFVSKRGISDTPFNW